MSYSPVPVESFAGLNLIDDAGTVGWTAAIDCLNVEFDRRGRVRSRDGFTTFSGSAGAARFTALGRGIALAPTAPYIVSQLVFAARGNNASIYDTSGVLNATAITGGGSPWSFQAFGTPTAGVTYAANGTDTIWKVGATD